MIKEANREEIWLSIPGYEDVYEISSLGRVCSLNYNHTGRRQMLRLGTNYDYNTVTLASGGTKQCIKVAILVANIFIGPPPGQGYQVNHKDRDKLNDSVDNLEWVTPSENTMHAYATGVHARQKAVIQLTIEGNFVARFRGTREAARQLGKPNGQNGISAVCRQERSTAYGYKWVFEEACNESTS